MNENINNDDENINNDDENNNDDDDDDEILKGVLSSIFVGSIIGLFFGVIIGYYKDNFLLGCLLSITLTLITSATIEYYIYNTLEQINYYRILVGLPPIENFFKSAGKAFKKVGKTVSKETKVAKTVAKGTTKVAKTVAKETVDTANTVADGTVTAANFVAPVVVPAAKNNCKRNCRYSYCWRWNS